jgi:phenylpropionate dioxygenase-like ring-hydroxylating dioxygenase large terminal subunit
MDQSVGANSKVYLRNAWYVAATSDSVEQKLQPVRMLGTDLVLYRTRDGKPVALDDACPHRKLPLSMGRLVGDAVECGYHGLTFDSLGKCVAAPTQDRIPSTAAVKCYPAIDRYGLFWIWMGDSEKADESLLLSIENIDNPAWHITSGDSLICECNYLYLVDNLLDPSHVAWVHRTSFAAAGTEDTPLEMQEFENGLLVSRWIYDCDAPPFYQPLLTFEGSCDRLQHYEVRFPSVAINKGIYSPAGRGGPDWVQDGQSYEMISYNFLTPIDENSTRYFWLQQRNTDPDDDAITQQIASGARQAFTEDKVILEAVHNGIATESSRHINLGLDAAANRFRALLTSRITAEDQQTP